jgi:hypothetical protein
MQPRWVVEPPLALVQHRCDSVPSNVWVTGCSTVVKLEELNEPLIYCCAHLLASLATCAGCCFSSCCCRCCPAGECALIIERPPQAMGTLNRILGEREYLEDIFSAADVAVGGYLVFIPTLTPDLDMTPYPNVIRYMHRSVPLPTTTVPAVSRSDTQLGHHGWHCPGCGWRWPLHGSGIVRWEGCSDWSAVCHAPGCLIRACLPATSHGWHTCSVGSAAAWWSTWGRCTEHEAVGSLPAPARQLLPELGRNHLFARHSGWALVMTVHAAWPTLHAHQAGEM